LTNFYTIYIPKKFFLLATLKKGYTNYPIANRFYSIIPTGTTVLGQKHEFISLAIIIPQFLYICFSLFSHKELDG